MLLLHPTHLLHPTRGFTSIGFNAHQPPVVSGSKSSSSESESETNEAGGAPSSAFVKCLEKIG